MERRSQAEHLAPRLARPILSESSTLARRKHPVLMSAKSYLILSYRYSKPKILRRRSGLIVHGKWGEFKKKIKYSPVKRSSNSNEYNTTCTTTRTDSRNAAMSFTSSESDRLPAATVRPLAVRKPTKLAIFCRGI
jgi:hypothetical protein